MGEDEFDKMLLTNEDRPFVLMTTGSMNKLMYILKEYIHGTGSYRVRVRGGVNNDMNMGGNKWV